MKLKPTEESEAAKKFFDASQDVMTQLAERWKDEWQYEAIGDYQKVIQKAAHKFGVIVKGMIQKPFGCEFEVDERTFRYTAYVGKNTTRLSYQRIK